MNDPEKKRRIQEQLDRLRDERTSRLEAAAANRDALRSQFSRIIVKKLNSLKHLVRTTVAELHTPFSQCADK